MEKRLSFFVWSTPRVLSRADKGNQFACENAFITFCRLMKRRQAGACCCVMLD